MRCLFLLLALLPAALASAQDRHPVQFSISYSNTSVGQSVFVLGNIPELGNNDIRKAIKLEPTQWPLWKATFSLPAGTTYTYSFYRRDDGPGRGADTTNQLLISGPFTASTPPNAPSPARPPQKAILYHSAFTPPVLYWRTPGSATFTRVDMTEIAPGRSPAERRWLALDIALGQKPVEFYFTSPDGASRDPFGSAVYSTALDAVFVQDGNLFSYVPAPAVAGWRRDYSTANLPFIASQFLTVSGQPEPREYRVILPRGYDQHTARRYPVVYLHDGQNVFEAGPFGTWNAHTTAGSLTAAGQMREVILVGVDNGPNRLSDYSAPDAGGNGANYVRFLRDELKPLIDSRYRTLPDAANTAAIGSSMGGHISLYMGWDYASTFTRIGAFSGAFQIFNSGFYNRVQSQPKRAIRLYLDSGDAGTASDNYWPILNLRDNLINPARAGGSTPFLLEGDLKHVVGQGQQHNEPAWAARLPDAYRFLLPAAEDQGPLLPLATGAAFDTTADGVVTIDDLYALYQTPRDINLDGVTTDADAAALEWYLRRTEPADTAANQR